MSDPQFYEALRFERWQQTPETRVPDPDAAAALIKRVGIATLYPVSLELPNLFHAYVGDPAATTDSSWDSPAGQVYTWRWELGRREAGFYTALVRSRPTWVSWELLPALLRLRGELRAPDELFDANEISANAQAIASVLVSSGGVLGTGELRRRAGFPTGKAERAAYLKAIEELDTRMLLAKVFSHDDQDMRHALVSTRYPDAVAAARALSTAEAIDLFLAAYLPAAIYVLPKLLAKHLKFDENELRAGLERLTTTGAAHNAMLAGAKEPVYVWNDEETKGMAL